MKQCPISTQEFTGFERLKCGQITPMPTLVGKRDLRGESLKEESRKRKKEKCF